MRGTGCVVGITSEASLASCADLADGLVGLQGDDDVGGLHRVTALNTVGFHRGGVLDQTDLTRPALRCVTAETETLLVEINCSVWFRPEPCLANDRDLSQNGAQKGKVLHRLRPRSPPVSPGFS